MIENGRLQVLARMNWPIVVAMLLLCVIGVLFVYSAGMVYSDTDPLVRWQRQAQWMLVGAVCYLGFVLIDYRRVCKESWWIYGAALFLLVLVLLVGKQVYGGKRWLVLLGGLTFQPAEFAKLGTIILLARFLCRPNADMSGIKELVLVLGLTAIPVLLIAVQPDVGTAMVFLPIAFIMLFVAGMRGRLMLTLLLIGVLTMGFVLGAIFLPEKLDWSDEAQEKALKLTGLREYHKQRIATFFNPDRDRLKYGYNRIQSEIAVGSGGLTGKGYLMGRSTMLGYLPRTVAPSDFIFSVIAEEKGFMGAVGVLFLFGTVIAGCLHVAVSTRDKLGRLLCVGVAAMLFVHVFVNISMTIGLMPIIGLPLPLMSAGGTFIVCTMSALGLVQSVYVRRRLVRYEK